MKKKWLLPFYYKEFECKCSNCRHSCCHGWNIPVSKKEYFNLIAYPYNNDLRKDLDVAFKIPDIVSEERYRIISFNYNGDCPLQKKGLCEIHSILGPINLPKVCQLYPRSLKKINEQLIACCSSSCERVVELLLNNKSLDLTYEELDEEPNLFYEVPIEYQNEISVFQNILQDRSTSLKESIERICLIVNKQEFLNDYNHNSNPVIVAMNLLKRLVSPYSFLSEIDDNIESHYRNNLYQFECDKNRFEERYPDWNILFENILNNSLLYENFPFVDDRFDKTLAYKGLCASYGLLRLICIGHMANHDTDEDLVDAIAALFHLIDHTAFYYNVNVLVDCAALLLKV